MADGIKALTFDVFGTVVDWRSSIIAQGQALGERKNINGVDWADFADAWRAAYQPAMEEVRRKRRPWANLDQLHRENLDRVLAQMGITGLTLAETEDLNRAWHRLDPWPDAVAGLTRLKKRYIIAPLSNGNLALLVNMAKRAGLPWDAILGAEVARHYKPEPEAYLTAVRLLGLEPEQVMMTAAHNSDLVAAQALGLKTAFVVRPSEHGPGQTTDLKPEGAFDVVARDFLDLADQLDA